MLYAEWIENLSDDPQALRQLFLLSGDKDSVAALDRKTMGQPATIQTDR